jgi:hypothetical protein
MAERRVPDELNRLARCVRIESVAADLVLPGWLPRGTLARPLLLKQRGEGVSGVSSIGRDALADAGVIREDARITVSRDSPQDAGFREIFVSVDREPLGILRHGESITTEVPAGPHYVRAHNTLFWKTHQIVLRPGEHARFIAINRAGWGTFGMLFILGAMPVYLTFERVPVTQLSPSAKHD